MTNSYSYTDVIDIMISIKGGASSRIHFQLETECTSDNDLKTITYNLTNFLDSDVYLLYLAVDDQLFPFDTGLHPGNIGKVQLTRKGYYLPAEGSVYVESDSQRFEFGSLNTAVLRGH